MKVFLTLDCPPGSSRPSSYLADVLEGMVDYKTIGEPVSKVFGEWKWIFEVEDDKWSKELLGSRVKALYHQGAIRYGEWGVDE